MTITFQLENPPSTKVEVTICDNANLDEVVEACRSAAFAMGYNIENILDSFRTGDDLIPVPTMKPLEENY